MDGLSITTEHHWTGKSTCFYVCSCDPCGQKGCVKLVALMCLPSPVTTMFIVYRLRTNQTRLSETPQANEHESAFVTKLLFFSEKTKSWLKHFKKYIYYLVDLTLYKNECFRGWKTCSCYITAMKILELIIIIIIIIIKFITQNRFDVAYISIPPPPFRPEKKYRPHSSI
jgi:hypothetical protein